MMLCNILQSLGLLFLLGVSYTRVGNNQPNRPFPLSGIWWDSYVDFWGHYLDDVFAAEPWRVLLSDDAYVEVKQLGGTQQKVVLDVLKAGLLVKIFIEGWIITVLRGGFFSLKGGWWLCPLCVNYILEDDFHNWNATL